MRREMAGVKNILLQLFCEVFTHGGKCAIYETQADFVSGLIVL